MTGASGVLGSAVVPRLEEDGHDVRRTSRHPRAGWVKADLATGQGLVEAVDGVEAVVHLASATKQYRKAGEVDVAGTRRLVTAAERAGLAHVVLVSIVGIDRIPFGYYRSKLAAEKVLQASQVPWSILRATQFPQLVDERFLPLASRLGVLVTDPGITVQLVDPRDVAGRIGELLAGGPSYRVENFGGPEVQTLDEIVRSWLRATGRHRPVISLRLPGKMLRAMREGALTTTDQPTGIRTWEAYLAERYAPVQDSQA
ncbi:SDR family oxidoreductase [Phytohabitans houttuyneae]|uniref:Nucleotide-diphosphate-sugar epimerase n=1 Tax=Phytohabitans houttuyneae TaxID=1076126 RepID=A0A6V8KCY2_9ACTN|nr:NAD(P)H-binding protein [Phytohabitans houttuyneae]GFJ79866.1 nucleotide-diphosphate-sugar epimerase [Phytohabitans houttuyneae]